MKKKCSSKDPPIFDPNQPQLFRNDTLLKYKTLRKNDNL